MVARFSALVLLSVGTHAAAADRPVADRDSLIKAIAEAKGGEVLKLAPGEYGKINIRTRVFAKPLTIASQDPSKPASMTIHISASEGLNFRDLALGRTLAPGEPDFTSTNEIGRSRNISFDRIHFHGSLDEDPSNDARGLYVVFGNGIRITNSHFEQLFRAFIFDRTENIEVRGNRFNDIRSDAGDFAGVAHVVIDNNSYTDFRPAEGDHADAIQFWTAGQEAGSYDIQITNNRIIQGDGVGPQGIFMADEKHTMPNRDIRIENNILYSNDQWEGISVLGAENVTITNNTTLSDPDDGKKYMWIRLERVRNATVTNNVTERIVLGDANQDIRATNNIGIKDDPGKAKLIPNLRAGQATTWRDLVVPGRGFDPAAASLGANQK